MTANPLQAYGNWIATVAHDWPEAALESAYRELIDTIAVMIPGALTPVVQIALGRVRHWGRGDSTVVGGTERLALPWAALINATAGHALDFDDNFDPAKAHVSTVLWPSILALAEQQGSSPQECLDAYIVALQIQGRIGQGLNPAHRKRGWHATSTTGALGAAAAGARLLRLPAEQAAMALSLATSSAGGFMSQFGTMAKPLHAGLAAKAGVMAACFAQDGMTAGWHTLDGPTGMNTLMVGPDREALRAAIGTPQHGQTLTFETESIGEPLLITEHKFRVKRFPTCGSAHRSIDAVLALREEYGFRPEDVERVDIVAPTLHLNNLMYQRPEDGLQGKFSVEYPVACAIIQGNCTLADFTDEALARPGHRALFERIHRHPVECPETEMDTEVDITLKDGRKLKKAVFMALGSKTAPFANEQYWQKFSQCAQGLMKAADYERLRQSLAGFGSLATAGEMVRQLGVELQS
ncbi:MAG: MmgE/PrpD family protein [Pseudomonadales bacterium]|nr:MmgE/PrpD family protein [Pseudomonadales bacterium]